MGTNINIESNPEISTDQDEIHTATLEFTYKTHILLQSRKSAQKSILYPI